MGANSPLVCESDQIVEFDIPLHVLADHMNQQHSSIQFAL